MILTIKGQTYEKYQIIHKILPLIKSNMKILSSHYNFGCFFGKR